MNSATSIAVLNGEDFPRPMGATAPQSFSAEQLEQRRQTLGASEIPVVAGLVPFKSPIQLWMEKRGLVQSFEGNEFTEWGNRLESVVADAYAEKRGVAVHRSASVVHPIDTWMSATPDRLVMNADGVIDRGLEVKCRGEYRGDEWGDPGTDEVPHDVAIQTHWSMIVTGLARWDVATLIGGNKFRMYELHYDADIAASLVGIGRAFWFDHVLAGVQPPIDGSTATTELLKKRFRTNTDVLRDATMEEAHWLADLQEVREEKAHIEKREAELKNLLMNAIGDAAGITSPVGKATWKAPSGSVVQWKEVATVAGATPEQIAQFSKPQSRRFLPTFPKAK